jgi:hypothetical protein
MRLSAFSAGWPDSCRPTRPRAGCRVAGPGRPVPHRLRQPRHGLLAWRPRVLHAALAGSRRPAGYRRAALRAQIQRAVARRVHGHGPTPAARPPVGGTARISSPYIRTERTRPACARPAQPRTALSGTTPAWTTCAGPARGTAGLAVAASGRRSRSVAADQAGRHRSLGNGRDWRSGCPDFGRTGGILGYGSHRAGRY